MARGYLVFVLLAGIFASVLGGGLSRAPAPAKESFRNKVEGDNGAASLASSEDDEQSEEGMIEIDRSADGHFYADVEINGASVRALIDTGATGIALSRDDARSAGLATSIGMPSVVGRGADGDVHGEYVTLERVVLGHKTGEDMDAVVLNSGEQTLLGQTFLSKFNSVEIKGNTMVLR